MLNGGADTTAQSGPGGRGTDRRGPADREPSGRWHDGHGRVVCAASLTSRAKRWLSTDLRCYPTLSAEDETEDTLAAAPTESQLKQGKSPLESS